MHLIQHKITDYFFKNIISCLSLSITTLGGLVFWLYFTGVRYLPQLDLLSSLTMVIFSALTGIFLVALIFLLFYIPGLLWKSYIDSGAIIPKRINRFINPLANNQQKENRQAYIYLTALPFTFWASLLLMLGLYKTETQTCWIVLNGVVAIVLFLSICIAFKIYLPTIFKRQTYKKLKCGLISYLLISFFCCMTAFSSFYLMIQFTDNKESTSEAFIALLFWLCITIIMLKTSIKEKTDTWLKHTLITALLITVLLISFTTLLGNLPSSVIKIYKLGNIDNATLILSKGACSALSIKEPKKENCQLENVHIVSRIGTEYLIRDEAKEVRYTIQSKDVLHFFEPIKEKIENKKQP